LLAAALALAPAPGSAQSVSDADARAMREVIEAQLEAFRRDDAPRAFSYAAPEIRESFGTPDPMVKQPDGTWRINGCQLARLPARET
jgi:hypothetical protein